MAVAASTVLDTIWGLMLNVFNGVLELLSWAVTNQTDIIGGVIVVVTLGIVLVFGKSIGSFVGKLLDKVLKVMP